MFVDRSCGMSMPACIPAALFQAFVNARAVLFRALSRGVSSTSARAEHASYLLRRSTLTAPAAGLAACTPVQLDDGPSPPRSNRCIRHGRRHRCDKCKTAARRQPFERSFVMRCYKRGLSGQFNLHFTKAVDMPTHDARFVQPVCADVRTGGERPFRLDGDAHGGAMVDEPHQ